MEERILRYYLKVFSIIIVFLFVSFFCYTFYILNKNIIDSNKIISINKGEAVEKILKKNFQNLNSVDIFFIKKYYQVNFIIFNKFIHFGYFNLNENISSIELLNTITKPSNYLNKITIVEGWSKNELNRELSKFFENFTEIPYEDIIADTYFFEKNEDFFSFLDNLRTIKKKNFYNYKEKSIFDTYSSEDIMIIGSLLEKEGLDYNDKIKISSVIFNRLNKNMFLQIDATVLFAITNGTYDLNRNLLRSDLKINHPFNTYKNKGLPPKPISYVGKKTIEILFENYKSEFMFYFFDKSLNRHVFSKTFKEHKRKLNEYRNK